MSMVKCVQNVINYIIDNENYKTPPEVDVIQGSQDGDGYIAKTYAISIKSNRKITKLFVKYLPESTNEEWREAFEEAFNVEYNFYANVYPVFDQFQKSKNIKDPFNNVPKHYKTKLIKESAPPIVLENLRNLGYTLRDRKKPIDDSHLKLPIEAFAKFHAISYALKDQEPEKYKALTSNIGDVFGKYFQNFGMDNMLRRCIDQFLESLDPIVDKNLLKHCENLDNRLIEYLPKVYDDYDEYFIITQGDCWSNNMMFLYDEETNLPINVKLIDWQCQRISSPLLDFSYFFYTLATKKELDNADFYLNSYYNALSKRIAELGSDPEKMYPYAVFKDHWRKYSLFGLCMAFTIVKAQLFEPDEVPNILNPGDEDPIQAFSAVLKDQDTYVKRIRDLVEYFIKEGII